MMRWVCEIWPSMIASYSRMPSKRRYSALGRLPLCGIAGNLSSLMPIDRHPSLVTEANITSPVPLVKKLRGFAAGAGQRREPAAVGEPGQQPCRSRARRLGLAVDEEGAAAEQHPRWGRQPHAAARGTRSECPRRQRASRARENHVGLGLGEMAAQKSRDIDAPPADALQDTLCIPHHVVAEASRMALRLESRVFVNSR